MKVDKKVTKWSLLLTNNRNHGLGEPMMLLLNHSLKHLPAKSSEIISAISPETIYELTRTVIPVRRQLFVAMCMLQIVRTKLEILAQKTVHFVCSRYGCFHLLSLVVWQAVFSPTVKTGYSRVVDSGKSYKIRIKSSPVAIH